MKKIYFILTIVALTLPCFAGDLPLKRLDRQTALDGALKNNPLYLAAIEDTQSAKYSYIGSFSEFLPTANLGWSARNSESTLSNDLQASESYTATAGINLFRGFRSYTSVNRSRLNFDSYSESERETLLKTIQDVNLAYQAALRADYLRKSYYTLFESAELLLAEAQVRQQLDVISRADLYQAKADRERAYSTYLDAYVAYM
ncbi:MAG: TolC family protein, partial [Deferribacteraceae bacterium]|nr:TolC family protein [Deferribacteraceae bacterium]